MKSASRRELKSRRNKGEGCRVDINFFLSYLRIAVAAERAWGKAAGARFTQAVSGRRERESAGREASSTRTNAGRRSQELVARKLQVQPSVEPLADRGPETRKRRARAANLDERTPSPSTLPPDRESLRNSTYKYCPSPLLLVPPEPGKALLLEDLARLCPRNRVLDSRVVLRERRRLGGAVRHGVLQGMNSALAPWQQHSGSRSLEKSGRKKDELTAFNARSSSNRWRLATAPSALVA